MSIDTRLPGSPASVRAAADWLEQLAAGLDSAGDDVVSARRRCSSAWEGATADAYYDLAGDIVKATDEIHNRARDAAVVARAYANQLQWRQEDMAGHRGEAVAGGLVVRGTVIEQPEPAAAVPDLPVDATPHEATAWGDAMDRHAAQVAKIEVWNEVVGKVQATWQQLDEWVTQNLATAQDQAVLPSLVSGLLGAARSPDTYLGIAENAFGARADTLTQAADDAAVALARLRSGNPAVAAGAVSPSATGVANASKPGTRAGNLLDEAAEASRWGRVLRWGGPVVATGVGAYQISQGESPSRVGLETAAGIGTGILLGGAATAAVAAGAPVILVGAGVALVGAGVAWGVGTAYEAWVPQDVREAIDEGIKDTWHAATDPIGDAVGGAWDAVFG